MHKSKKTLFSIFVLQVAITICCLAHSTRAASIDLVISEVLVGGNSADEEFIELYNPTSTDMDLKSLPLKLHVISSAGTDTSKTLTYASSDSTIKARSYFILDSAAFQDKHPEIIAGLTYSASLVSNGAVYISTSATKDSNIIDSVCWGTSTKCAFPLPDPKQNYSLERIENGPDWQESCETGGTPGKESAKCEKKADPPPKEETAVGTDTGSGNGGTKDDTDTTASEKVYLNEIFPNPREGSVNEYIEIANGESKPVDLYGWRIKDASKSKGYEFKEHIILDPDEYLAIYRTDSKIALNNSDESVYLYNPKKEMASSASFEKSQKDASYDFDGKNWKWSKYLTPGKQNKFDSEPSVKITKPKHIYKDLLTEFSAKAKDKESKKLKYAWDFGDGKKSYLAKTSHKYLDTGKYTVALSVSDDSQTVEKSFSINVKKSPRPNIEITKIVPNPAGNDNTGEIVEVKNNSGQKTNLAGWKIATGSGEKIYNHPISGKVSIDPNAIKIITREFSKFSLNNKAGKVQLVTPDEKVIDEVEYAKEKITEGEAYTKIDGEWQWFEPNTQELAADDNDGNSATAEQASDTAVEEDAADGEVLGAADESESIATSYNPAFSSEDAFIFLSNIGFLKLQNKEINYCPFENTTASLEYFLFSSI